MNILIAIIALFAFLIVAPYLIGAIVYFVILAYAFLLMLVLMALAFWPITLIMIGLLVILSSKKKV